MWVGVKISFEFAPIDHVELIPDCPAESLNHPATYPTTPALLMPSAGWCVGTWENPGTYILMCLLNGRNSSY